MRLTAFARDRRGVAAIEFALLAPAFIMLLVGTMSLSALLFSTSSLHYAAQTAARCASVRTAVCGNAAATAAFAQASYFGIGGTPVFTCVGRSCGGTAACGNRVTAQVEIVLDIGIARHVVPLRADACYP